MNGTSSGALQRIRQLTKGPRVRRCGVGVSVTVFCLALASCSNSKVPGSKPLTTENLLGTYELISYAGQTLPTGNGRDTYYGGELVLGPKQLYAETIDREACYPVRPCTRESVTDSGTWLLLGDSTLYLDSTSGYSYPHPRVEADGREVQFYIPDIDMLGFTYRRK